MTGRLWASIIIMLLASWQARGRKIEAVVSRAIFYSYDTPGKVKPYIETCWEINPRTLVYTKSPEGTLAADVITRMMFFDDLGNQLHEESYLLQTKPKAKAEELVAQNIIDTRKIYLPAGHITMYLMFSNKDDSTNAFRYTDTFTILKNVASVPLYSSLQLLDTAFANTTNTPFLKNGKQQIPLCSNFYDDWRNRLHYYVELYNASALGKEDYPLTQSVFISKKEGQVAYERFFEKDTILSGSKMLPFSGDFDIGTLGSGNYYLNVHLLNSRKKVLATNVVFFQRMKPKPEALPTDTATNHAATRSVAALEEVTVLDLNKTFIAKYTLPQVLAILKMLLPISSNEEAQTIRGFLKKPDETYTRYYIYNYFAGRNKADPEKAWKDFTATVKEVNKLFGSSYKPGYETERGALYLRYGKPTERVIVENEQGTFPYEIWQYNSLKAFGIDKTIANGIFLFYKPQELINDYRLLHSTVPGEMRNMSWRSFLYTNGMGSNSANPRAEQYIGNR